MNKILDIHRKKIESEINNLFSSDSETSNVVCQAMKYSLSGGGKRIRPVLMMEFHRICGGNPDDIINLALSLECIHTYSLIHDDLPCMDNDDFRRGKPSCHKAYGETTALLAGDALLTFAFSLAASCSNIEPKLLTLAIKILADNSGFSGMVGGQVEDLALERRDANQDELSHMYLLKTGKLIEAACLIGCITANADDEKQKAAKRYANDIGLSFQIIDDVLDCIGDSEVIGKPVGSDEKNNKTTFVSLFGVEQCIKKSEELTADAIDSLSEFEDADELKQLALSLIKRQK